MGHSTPAIQLQMNRHHAMDFGGPVRRFMVKAVQVYRRVRLDPSRLDHEAVVRKRVVWIMSTV